MKVGLSGTGRIGRLVLRRALEQKDWNWSIGLINSTLPVQDLVHLLQYDSTHGKWNAEVTCETGAIIIDDVRIPVVSEKDPERIPWADYGVDTVIDATGRFVDRSGASKHLLAGAQRVVLTSPSKDADATVVMGVNDQQYVPAQHRIVSVASCTTNCLAPVLSILDRAFGVEKGWMTTVHAFTNDQNHMDNGHKDLRRARSCTSSIIPTTTGVSQALADVLPELASCIQGNSIRVPVQDVSLIDLQVTLKSVVSQEDVRAAFKAAIASGLGRFVGYNELPLVSSDYIGNPHSAIIDGLSITTRENEAKILAWYDNEWAYACRVCDVTQLIAEQEYCQLNMFDAQQLAMFG